MNTESAIVVVRGLVGPELDKISDLIAARAFVADDGALSFDADAGDEVARLVQTILAEQAVSAERTPPGLTYLGGAVLHLEALNILRQEPEAAAAMIRDIVESAAAIVCERLRPLFGDSCLGEA